MKKSIITAAILASIVTTSVFAADAIKTTDVAKIAVELSKETAAPKETVYVSLFATDANGGMIDGLKPTVKANPTYLVTLGNFVNCATAEGREICSNFDDQLVGMKGAYVMPITIGAKTGKVDFEIYAGTKMATKTLQIGSITTAVSEVKSEIVQTTDNETTPVETKSAPETNMANVKTGGSVNGKQWIIIGALLFLASAVGMSVFDKKHS